MSDYRRSVERVLALSLLAGFVAAAVCAGIPLLDAHSTHLIASDNRLDRFVGFLFGLGAFIFVTWLAFLLQFPAPPTGPGAGPSAAPCDASKSPAATRR